MGLQSYYFKRVVSSNKCSRFLHFQGPQPDNCKYAVAPADEGAKGKKKGQKKDMDELKQELTMDEHKIPITELYSRLNSDPTTVSGCYTRL